MSKRIMANEFEKWIKHKDKFIFPNISTIAYYNGFSQLIHFNTIEREHSNIRDVSKNNEITKIMAHETQHWIDHISTLWGQNNLISLYNAMGALYEQKAEDFWMLRKLWTETKNSKLIDYYTLINDKYESINSSPWQWQFSAGSKFDYDGRLCSDKSILFVKFQNFENQLVCRVPVTIEALLETNAMATEFEVHGNYYLNLSEDERGVEASLLGDDCFKWLYNAKMAPYSVAGHILANSLKNTEVISTFRLSKKISTLCLNIPDSCFNNLKIPKAFAIWEEKNNNLIRQRDRGYLYALLIENAKQLYGKELVDYNKIEIDKILEASGLPSANKLEEMCRAELLRIRYNIKQNLVTSKLIKLLNIGLNFYKKRGITGENYSILEIMDENIENLPYIYADDMFDEDHYINSWIDFTWSFEKKIKEFNSICGI